MKLYLLLSAAALGLFSSSGWAAPFAGKIQEPVAQTLEIQQQSQQQADAWDAQRRTLVAELERLQQQQQQLLNEQARLQQQLEREQQEVVQLQRAIRESQRLGEEMAPFLVETQQLLHQQLSDDLPFLQAERQLRLQRLEAGGGEGPLSTGERFRRTFEALQIESEYGRSTEVTQGLVTIAGQEALMNQLRIGRLALFVQALDGQFSAIYDRASQSWQPLAKKYNNELRKAVEMAGKQRPIDLLSLPIGKLVVQ